MTDEEIIDGLYEIKNWKCNGDSKMHSIIRGAINLLEQKRWIPVSERLPEAYELVNCTCHSLIDDREDWVIETGYIPQPLDSPYSDWGNIPMLNSGDCEVVAWMHRDIPEPYKAESEEEGMSMITELVKILKDLYVDPELDMLCGVDGECRQAIKESAQVIEELSAKLQDEQNLRMKQESVLDEIKAEILDEAEYAYADFDRYKYDILYAEPDELPDDDFRYGLERAVEIINKHKVRK